MRKPKRDLDMPAETEARLRRLARQQGITFPEAVRNRLLEISRQQPEDLGPHFRMRVVVEEHVWEAAKTVSQTRRIPMGYLL
jgi:hypothetical protein